MVVIRESKAFVDFMDGLRDPVAKSRIAIRLRRLAFGNPGDVRSVGDGLSELRIDYGLGYRVYFMSQGETRVTSVARTLT